MGVQNPNRSVKLKAPKPKPLQPPKPEVSVQAKPRRGSAPNAFTESPIRNPIERMQTTQSRVTARAIQNAAHAERGGADKGAIPAAPNRPLKNAEVRKILASPQAQTIAATVPAPKKKGKGLKGLPLAVLGDIPAELKGAGALEKVVTRIGATSAKGWEMAVPGAVGHEVGNIVKDTSGVVAGAVPSVYIPASEAAAGHFGKAASTIYTGVKQTLAHPLEHPVSLALILRGGEGAVSRGAGELVRHSPSEAVRRYGSTERVPLSLDGTPHYRRASKGLIENRAQKAIDKSQAKKQGTTTVRVPKYNDQGKLVVTLKPKAIKASKHQLEAAHVVGGKLNRRVDTEAGKGNARVRDMSAQAMTALDKAKPKNGAEDAAQLVNEGVIKRGNKYRPLSPEMLREDLQQHLEQLQRAKLKGPAEVADNAASIDLVQRVLGNEKFMRDPQSVLKAARTYADTHRPLEALRGEAGDLTKGQIERRPLLVFAVREMGLHHQGPDEAAIHAAQRDVLVAERDLESATKAAKPGAARPLKEAKGLFEAKARLKALKNEYAGFVTSDGVPVSNQRIINAFIAKGGDPKDLAYLPTKADATGAQNFSGSKIRRPGAETKRFTGQAALAGTYERGFHVMRQQLSNAAVKVARHQSVTNLINTFGHKQSNGKFFDFESAANEIRDQKAANGVDYVAVTAARKTAPDTLVDEQTPAELEHTFRPAEPGDAHVVLFRKQVWDRLVAHEQGRSKIPAPRLLQQVSQTFRHVVLSTSTKWLFGNSFEAYLRMQINELTPMQVASTIRSGKRIEARLASLGDLGAQRAAELYGTSGPGMFVSQKHNDYHNPDSQIEGFARSFRNSGFGPDHMIGPKALARLWDGYRAGVTAVNKKLSEDSIYHYAIGKEARQEVQQMMTLWDRALRRAGPAYEAVARGLLDSNKIAQYADAVDAIRGRYQNLSPDGRYMVSTYTPFAPWYVNSLHFFAVTLPGHHPVKTGLLAAASQGTQAQRKKLNLPPWAQGVPVAGGVLPFQHFLPTGITEAGSAGVAGLVLPYAQGIMKNLEGQAWTGKQLPPGTNKYEMALNTALGTFIPFVNKAQTVLEKGGTAAPDSTIFHPKVKPGTKKNTVAGVVKAVSPIRIQKTARAVTGGTGVDSGPSAADILGSSSGPSVNDILGQ